MPHIADDDVSQIVDEWNAYRVDAEAVRMSADAAGKRVDHYWREILLLKACDVFKYANMAKLIKAVLPLPHGNAAVERGFSINNDMLTDDRTEMSAKIAQMMLEQGEKKMSDAAAQLDKTHAGQKRLLSHRPSSEPQCSEPKKKKST